MSWWRVTVTSEQAIVIGTGATRAFHTPSLGYIPGSTLRGALATAWRIRYGDPDSVFQETFDHSVRFGPLLAVTGDVANQSVLRRKYAPATANTSTAPSRTRGMPWGSTSRAM